MKTLIKHGQAPYSIVTIHGGPGAAGEMSPVARELSAVRGTLEPLQTGKSVKAQIAELLSVLQKHGNSPFTLIGFSWGAWLSYLVTAEHPGLVAKLILVGSCPFEEKYAAGIQQTRLNRLCEEDRQEVKRLNKILNSSTERNKNEAFCRLGALFSKADTFDSIEHKPEKTECCFDIYRNVWKEASEMRRSGNLLKLGENIKCPVIAVHGEYDPHSAVGVQSSLSSVLKNFRFILLKKCGHKPWIEKNARAEFYRIIKEELC